MADGQRFWFTDVPALSKDAVRLCTAKWELLQQKYKHYIIQNPDAASKVESMLRFLSYVLPGRFGASEALAELLYSASQLLSLTHDSIFRVGKGISDYRDEHQGSQLMLWLTVIEYLEVFVELGAERTLGEAGKWIIVIVVQIVKAALRLVLLLHYKSGIQRTPLIPSLDRASVFPKNREKDKEDEEKAPSDEKTCTESRSLGTEAPRPLWQGSRTGRVVRSLTASPKDGIRTWELPSVPHHKDDHAIPITPTELSSRQLFGESLYIARPLIHLSSMFVFGQKSWKPWFLSCGSDLTSLVLLGDSTDLNVAERAETSRRSILLLFYLLRSPFYDSYSKTRIIGLLRFISDTIPGMSLLLTPLIEYLPNWQRIYFYNWST